MFLVPMSDLHAVKPSAAAAVCKINCTLQACKIRAKVYGLHSMQRDLEHVHKGSNAKQVSSVALILCQSCVKS